MVFVSFRFVTELLPADGDGGGVGDGSTPAAYWRIRAANRRPDPDEINRLLIGTPGRHVDDPIEKKTNKRTLTK